MEPFVALGLDGLEVKHPGHSSEDMLRIAALADHFGLVKSGGSDWHGGNPPLGSWYVTHRHVGALLERLGIPID